MLLTPLILGEERLGVLQMATDSRQLGEDWLSFAKAVASQVVQAIELARTLAQLRASEQRYRDLVEGLDAIIWEADARTGQFTFVSQRAAKDLARADFDAAISGRRAAWLGGLVALLLFALFIQFALGGRDTRHQVVVGRAMVEAARGGHRRQDR